MDIDADGHLGSTLHRALTSDTRFQLINVAYWTSQEAFVAGADYYAELQELLDELPTLVLNRGTTARSRGPCRRQTFRRDREPTLNDQGGRLDLAGSAQRRRNTWPVQH
ncbi:antibiotic biosynthesis monooxygenase family protein [Nocardia sp. CA-107356]|uniref:antibiotic biosynthesis monooxygenase family protein n=1 Tax=Nocardia sp. CA-107356 TaxID=3239972 RepID=UPI003D8C8577